MKTFQQIRRQSRVRRMAANKPTSLVEGNRAALREVLGYPAQTQAGDTHAVEADRTTAMPASAVSVARECSACEPLPSGRMTPAGEVDEGEGPVSNLTDAGVPAHANEPADAGPPRDAAEVALPGGVPQTAPAQQQAPPSTAPACAITTRTLASAPDGTADTRGTVGVNERVKMTAPAAVTWTASDGTIVAAGTGATWTAPATAATSTITATPVKGAPCSVAMRAIPPTRLALRKQSNQSYTAGLAGSGFLAEVKINPLNVSFSRIEVREEAVNAVATGYYDTTLGWNGSSHPTGSWNGLDSMNDGLVDTVGTRPPGTASPFSAGTFTWPIPQSYRIVGGSGGAVYSTGIHKQVMAGTGNETTSKEGASNSRAP